MEENNTNSRFDGAAWFDRQVRIRTRAALKARGSKAKTKSREYMTEYARQLELFRAERAEKKRVKKEKFHARMTRQETADKAEA